jgi:hypothetical protein
MRTFTSSRRAVVATAVGLVLSLSLVGCSRIAALDAPSEAVGDATLDPNARSTPASPSPSQAASTATPTPPATPDPPDPTPDASYEWVGCSLGQQHGNLVAEDGRPVFRHLQGDDPPGDPLPLDFPDGWEVRATDDGQLEVVDRTGVVAGITGTHVIMYEDGNPDTPARNAKGAFVVCGMNPFWPELEEVPLLTGAPDGQTVDSCFTTWRTGLLKVDPTYGTAIFPHNHTETLPVAWRPGFVARKLGSEVSVFDPDWNLVAITGNTYRFDGAAVGDDSWSGLPTPLMFWACGSVVPQ